MLEELCIRRPSLRLSCSTALCSRHVMVETGGAPPTPAATGQDSPEALESQGDDGEACPPTQSPTRSRTPDSQARAQPSMSVTPPESPTSLSRPHSTLSAGFSRPNAQVHPPHYNLEGLREGGAEGMRCPARVG